MKELRQLRSALHQRLLDIEKLSVESRERALAVTNCQQARMLLGMTMRQLGCATPYPQSDNPGSPEVVPPADIAPANYDSMLPIGEIPAVKAIRQRIQSSLDELAGLRDNMGGLAQATLDAAYVELSLAKNWLGMDLARLAEVPTAAAAPFASALPPVAAEDGSGKPAEVVSFPAGDTVPVKGDPARN